MKIGLGLLMSRRRGGGGSPPPPAFSPADLFPTAWFRVMDATSLFQTTDTSTPITAVTQTIGRMNDLSGGARNATQATAGARPTYSRLPVGGVRRNTTTFSEEFDNAIWQKQNMGVTANSAVAPDGLTTADLLTPTAVSGRHYVRQANPNVGTPNVMSIYAKAAGYNKISLQESVNYIQGSRIVDLRDGTTVTQDAVDGTTTVEDVGGGWWRISWVPTVSPIVNNTFAIYVVPDSGVTYPWGTDWTPNGTDGVLIWGAQVEPAPLSDYQRVVTARDVTEAGLSDIFYAFDDGGDSINWTAPAGTYTIAYVVPDGTVTILTGQSLSGSTDALLPTQLVEYVAVNRTLTGGETADLTAYLEGVVNP